MAFPANFPPESWITEDEWGNRNVFVAMLGKNRANDDIVKGISVQEVGFAEQMIEDNLYSIVVIPSQTYTQADMWYDRENSTWENPVFSADVPFHAIAAHTTQQISVNDTDVPLQNLLDSLSGNIVYKAVGGYTGNGELDPRTISLGFTPTAVILVRSDGLTKHNSIICGGIATTNAPVKASDDDKALEIVEGGFKVFRGVHCITNGSLRTYNYVAIG